MTDSDDGCADAHWDDRLRLFSFATAERRADYLWVLRAFDSARAAYVVLLHADDVAEWIERNRITLRTPDLDYPNQPVATPARVDRAAERRTRPADPHVTRQQEPETPAPDHSPAGESNATAPPLTAAEIGPLLDQLHRWGVLERSYDGTRAATLAEYRNRHYVYQFSQAGFQAYRAVADVLGARLDEASLSRLVLPELLADLHTLAEANRACDAERVYRTLRRLDAALSDLAARAAHFYLGLGDLVRTTEITPESFLAHKDALLAHMREFSLDLARFTPRLAAAIAEIEETGVEELIARAARCDERVLLSVAERQSDWQARWDGLRIWFVASGSGESAGPTEAERLREATMSAIAAVLSLLRRVTETRRGGVSRESALRHLAAWFTAAPTTDGAHALFDAVFGLGKPRHLAMEHPDADVIPAMRSWWDAPPLEISRTLAETGRPPSAGAPARIHRNDAGIRRLREAQLDAQRARAEAARSLASGDLHERVLDERETEVLLRLLDAASTAWVPVRGTVAGTTGSDSGVTLTVSEHHGSTVVRTTRGLLHLNNRALKIEQTIRTRSRTSGERG
ncbi:TIGR02677 family protein [Nocardia sp. NBC_00508]|uniref:TIGR02677 family protein n=1 Tax=Nocardia sp. NBC_00508 TaxID=2975992 RepID=UPI002E80B756|nr:TIGR02677 family protein [Nocardia sp. NBC_00508]WUD65572.1 TIGR02677 family protein [Nocardia sp. NBC_00508]